MPIYQVTNDATGVTLELEGDRDPDQEDINRAFAFYGQQKYPNAPVLQEPTSLYEQAKSVAPSLARLASPLGYGRPTSQDVATAGRVLQQVSEAPGVLIDKALGRDTYRKPEEMLDAASRIERQGIMALGSASTDKRERAAQIGRSLGETISEYTPIPEYVTRPAGEVFGQVSADLLSPMNVMGLGIAGAARQAVRIPALVAGTEFAESTTPAAVRAAQIADLTRTSEAAEVVDQAAKAIPRLLVPEITRGSAESAGIALQTISDPNATAEEKLKASYEALIGTLFAAGLGAEVARSLGVRGKKVTQVDILNNLASQKKTVGEAIGQVSGLLDQMERIVPVENLKTQFRKYINELNPDEPFVYSKEPVGEGPRSRSRFVPDEERVALEKENAFVEQQKKSQQSALEKSAEESGTLLKTEASGTPLKTVAELFEDRNRPPVMESKAPVPPEEVSTVRRGTVTPEAVDILEKIDAGGVPSIITRNLERILNENGITVTDSDTPNTAISKLRQLSTRNERIAAIRKVLGQREFTAEELIRGESVPEVPSEQPVLREGGKLSARESIEAEGTPLRSVEDILAERLRVRDERIAAEKQPAAQTSTPLETVEQKLSRALNARDTRLASEAVAEALESGAARGEPVKVTRSSIEKSLGIGKKRAGQSAASEIIFNEVWDKALQETQGKFRQKAEGVAQKLEGLRTEVDVGLGANPFPQLMGAAWNGALSVAQAVIRAGGSVADGVAAGIRYARQNFKGKFDDAEFGSQLARLIDRPSPVQVPTGMQPRRFAERVAAAPGVPPVIREAVAASPEASYKRQNLEQTKQEAAVKTTGELNADIVDPESNVRIASAVELMNRQLAAGGISDVVDTTLKTAKKLTTFGQLINQAKLLNSTTREGIIYLVTKAMAERGRTPDGPQLKKLGDMMDVYKNTKQLKEKSGLKLKEAANSGDNKAYDLAIKEFSELEDVLRASNVDLVTQISRMNPSSLPDLYLALVQGSVQSTTSLVGNLFGNVLGRPFGVISDILAYQIDSNLFKGKLGNTFDLRARTIDRINSLKRSLPEAYRTVLKGSESSPYEAGGDIGTPLNFTRAARNVYDRVFNDAKDIPLLRNAIESTLGIYPDTIFRLNQSVDNIFRSADRVRLIREIGGARGLTDLQIKAAQRDPNLYLISDAAFEKGAKGFTADDLGVIEFESARGVFQQENAVTRGVAGVNRYLQDKKTARGVFYTPARILSLFQKTPINVAAEMASYTPAGLLRTPEMWSDLAPRERSLVASKMLVGAMVLAAYNQLYSKGVITANLDTPGDTNKARELSKSGGVMPPGSLNTSGLARYLKGEDPRFQPGDQVKDLGKFGLSGALGMMVGTARRIQELGRTDSPDWLVVGGSVVFSGLNFIMQQSFLDGINGFVKTLSEESGSSLEKLAKKFLSTATAPLHPAILGNFMRAQREFVPVTGGESVIKDFTNELNQKYAALPLLDAKQLPLRRDLWGEAVLQTPKGENPWTYNFFSPWKNREIDADSLNTSIYRVWRRTADNRAIPSIPNPQITYGKTTFEKLDAEQFDRYAQLVGFWRRNRAERVYMTKSYQEGSDDLRIQLLSQAYDRGIKIGKYRFMKELKESGQTLTPMAPRRGFDE